MFGAVEKGALSWRVVLKRFSAYGCTYVLV